jgi:hypothetical protein
MKNTIVKIAAFLAVIIGMTGIAAADPFNLVITQASPNQTIAAPSLITLNQGASATLSLKMSNIVISDLGQAYPVQSCSITQVSGPADPLSAMTVSCPATLTPTTDPFYAVNTVTIINNNAAAGNLYSLYLKYNHSTATLDFGSASQTFSSIPEFPMVALPIASVIGLVYLFQYRRKKIK